MTEVSVIIPCYEEAESLRFLLPQLHSCLQPLGLAYEIIVVDSLKPMDDSMQVCSENGAAYINQEEKSGYGAAVRTGIKHAKGQHILFMDADGSHKPVHIPEMLALRQEYDVVIGSRYIQNTQGEMPFANFLLSKLLNLTYTTVLGLKFKDITGSFKLYRAQQLQSLRLNSDNFDILEEMLYKLVKQYPYIRVKEVPVEWENRRCGTTKRNYILFGLSFIKTLIKLRFFE